MPEPPRLATLPRLSPTGTPATLRVVLPPNLASSAPRDAIAVRFEIAIQGRGQVPAGMVPDSLPLTIAPAQLSAIFLIESWNQGRAASMAQLSRAQLSALLAVLIGEPVFFFANQSNQALIWVGDSLTGVSEHVGSRKLAESATPLEKPRPQTAPAAPVDRPRTDATPPIVDGSEHFLALQLPSREHYAYEQILDLLKSEGFRLEPSNRKWWLRDRHKTLNFLAQHWSRLRDEWGAEFTPNFARNTAHLRFAGVDAGIQAAGDDFEVTLAVRAGNAPERDVHASLATGRTFVESAGTVFLFDRARLEKLHAAQRALAGTNAAPLLGRSTHRISRTRLAEADAVLADISPNLQPPDEWRRRTAVFRDLAALAPAPAPADLDQCLRPYQRLGAAWLWHLRATGLGGILADEMGLGKTLQALAVIAGTNSNRGGRRHDRQSRAGCLVVCPASLLENWRREAGRFAPRLRVHVHHGGARADRAVALREFDLVITSYGTLARDQQLFAGIEWDTLFADEAQHVKNRRTQNAQALQSLQAGGRILLTGTPVENSLGDLESLFSVILPGYLKGIPTDVRGDERRWHETRLRRQAAPYILRRTKAQVTPELPEKIEQTLFVEMTDEQRALYESLRTRTETELLELEMSGQSEGRIRMAMFTQLLRLRQVCGDPRLLEPQRDPAESAKLAALLELLDEAIDDGHRVLVFSQFTSLLALVRTALEAQGTAYAYLDGAMPPRARQAEVDRFNNSDIDLPVFLLSLKAGGTGLNLASADTVVHLDPWWNPAVEAQATDRAHRIGQARVVTSYKMIAAGTVEERVLAMQQEKRALLANVFEESDAANAALTLVELKTLVAP